MEKVTTIYQCVIFLHNVLGKSFYSLCGCPSISVRPQRKYIFETYFPFPAWFFFNWFFLSSTPFLPVKRFFRLTGKSSSDMSETSSPQDFLACEYSRLSFTSRNEELLKYSHYHHRNHLYNPHIQSHYPEILPKGLPQIRKWHWWQKLNLFISNVGNFRRHFVCFSLRGVLATHTCTRVCHARWRNFF